MHSHCQLVNLLLLYRTLEEGEECPEFPATECENRVRKALRIFRVAAIAAPPLAATAD